MPTPAHRRTLPADLSLIIFDLDGTLVDSLGDIAASMNEALARHGIGAHPLASYRQMVGNGMPVLVERALGARREEPGLAERVLADMREIYAKRQLEHTRPYPGIEELLHELKRRAIATAVLSNKPHDNTVTLVEHVFGKGRFAAIRGHVINSPTKPHPEGTLEILRQLDVRKEQAALAGDTDTDMQTARAAGLLGIGCLWGFRGREELEREGAAFVVAEPLEILELLANRR